VEVEVKTAASALGIDERPPLARGGLVRVLVVDRDPETRERVAAWCDDRLGAAVDAFGSAGEALNGSGGAGYDLCLLGQVLDGVDGVMLGAMIRALNPAARLVLMGDTFSAQLARRALEHGFQTVLAKPPSPAALDDLLDG
jgi:CheY-like chemotaxis protein